VRGLNSGLDDVGNLAWKLALVLQGHAKASLLDSYSEERVHATRENIAYGAKSTEFMAPPSYGFVLMREAALRLASLGGPAQALLNPRQSSPIQYPDRSLPAPEALLSSSEGSCHLSEYFGKGFVLLVFSDQPVAIQALATLPSFSGPASLHCIQVFPRGTQSSVYAAGVTSKMTCLIDLHDQAYQRFLAQPGHTVLIRPDAYVLAQWTQLDLELIQAALKPFRLQPTG
jgi:3-(3-hydroxy-phenyl)propionate hydroxylase